MYPGRLQGFLAVVTTHQVDTCDAITQGSQQAMVEPVGAQHKLRRLHPEAEARSMTGTAFAVDVQTAVTVS